MAFASNTPASDLQPPALGAAPARNRTLPALPSAPASTESSPSFVGPPRNLNTSWDPKRYGASNRQLPAAPAEAGMQVERADPLARQAGRLVRDQAPALIQGIGDAQRTARGAVMRAGGAITRGMLGPTADFVQGATGLPVGDMVRQIGRPAAPAAGTQTFSASRPRKGGPRTLPAPVTTAPALGGAAQATAAPITAAAAPTLAPNPADIGAGPPAGFAGPGARFAAGIGANGEPVFDNSSIAAMDAAGGSSRFSVIGGGIEAARAAGLRAGGATAADMVAAANQPGPKFRMPSSPAPNGGYAPGMAPPTAAERALSSSLRSIDNSISAMGRQRGRTARANVGSLMAQRAGLIAGAGAQQQQAASEAARMNQAAEIEAARMGQAGAEFSGRQALERDRLAADLLSGQAGRESQERMALIGAQNALRLEGLRQEAPRYFAGADGMQYVLTPKGLAPLLTTDGKPFRSGGGNALDPRTQLAAKLYSENLAVDRDKALQDALRVAERLTGGGQQAGTD